MLPSIFGRVGRIKGRHPYAGQFHIFQQIGQGRITGHGAGGHTLNVIGVVPLGGLYGATQLTSIIPHVEYLRGNVMKE